MKIQRYFLVGASASGLDFIIFTTMTYGFQVSWAIAGVISFFPATLANYALSVRYVFESGTNYSRRITIALVFLVSAFGLALNQFVLGLLIEVVKFD